MATSEDRVLTALNFLAGEGVDYYQSDCNDSAIEVFINDYFNDGSASTSKSDDESDHSDNQGFSD